MSARAMKYASMTAGLVGALTCATAAAQLLGEPPRGEATERHIPGEIKPTQWAHDPNLLGTQAGDRFETREVAAEELETVKLTNLVPPIHFAVGVAEIPDSTVAELREILESMSGRRN